MKNRSVSFRLVTATLIIAAFAAIAALGATSPAIQAFDSVKEFFGMAPTSQTVTTAPNQRLNAVAKGSMFTQPMFFAGPSVGTPLLAEDFNFSGLLTANGWTAHSGGGTNAITTASITGLTYTGYPSSGVGNAASMTTSGEDDNRSFTAQSSGSVYMAAMVNASASQTGGDYFLHLAQTSGASSTNFYGRVSIKKDSSSTNYAFGISKFGTSPTYTPFNYAPNTTYLIVVKYTFVSGTTNDTVDLFVNPVLNGTEPAVTITAPDNLTAADTTPLAAVGLRQAAAGNAATVKVDGIRVGTSWPNATSSNVTVTYDGNGNTGGTAPSDSNSPYYYGGTVTALTNSGSLTKTGFTFSGWNTAADGSGTDYAASGSATFAITANTTLYAKWTAAITEPTSHASAMTFSSITTTAMTVGWTSGNGANRIVIAREGSAPNAAPADGTGYTANTTFGAGSSIGTFGYVVYNGSGNSVTVTGLQTAKTYYFTVYEYNGTGATANYLTSGTPLSSSQQATATAPTMTSSAASGITTTTAQFNGSYNPNNSTSTVFFRYSTTNPGTCDNSFGTATATSSTAADSTPFTYSKTPIAALTPGTQYFFCAIGTNAGGTGVGSVLNFTTVAANHTVTFDGNTNTGGSTNPQTTNATTNLTSNGFTKTGYSFTGWNTAANGTGTAYTNGQSYNFAADLTLYAQWTINTFTITASVTGGNGTISPAGATVVNYGGNQTYTITPNAGYKVATLTIDGNSTPPDTTYPYINVTANSTIVATFALNDLTYSGTANLPAGSYHDITVGNGAVITLTGNIVITGTITVQSGGTLDMGGFIITGGGAFVLNPGGSLGIGTPNGGIWKNTTPNTGSIQLTGTRTYDTAAFYRFYGDVDSAVGDGLPTTVAGLTIENGSHMVTGNSVSAPGQVVTGTLNIISGNYVGHSDYNNVVIASGATLTLTDATTVSGTWTNSGGTLVHNNNLVTFDGTGAQALNGTTTFYDLAFAPGARTITFDNGGNTAITHAFTAAGTAGNLITLRSSSSGNQWTIDAPAATSVSYLDVKDSAANIPTITATHSVNSGNNNTNWLFNYTLTYAAGANGSLSGSPSQTVSYGNSGTAVTALPDAQYHFVNWSDASVSNPRTETSVTSDLSVTANFAINTYTVTYNGNGSTGGSVPVDGSSPYNSGTLVTTLGNTGSLVRTGYAFTGWNTIADGSGSAYSPGVQFTIVSNNTLFAQWTPIYTVTYDGNGSTGGTPPVDGNSPYNSGATVTVLGNTGSLVKTGYTFAGWNTIANGSGTSYAPAITFPILGNNTLYAQWTLNSYSVTYDGNTNTAGSAPATQNGSYNTAVTLAGVGTLVKTGSTFAGWNTLANGTGTNYAGGASYTIPASNTTLYAKWVANTFTLTATAGANGNFKFGNVNANGVTTVNPGDSKTYRIVPDFGYQIVDVLVDGVSVGKVASYTFPSISANHTIDATFEAVTNRTLTAGTLNSYYDAVIDVPVSVSDTSGANITSFDFSLNYDETKLEPVISGGTNVTITNGTLGTWSGNVVKAATGIINVSRFSLTTPASGAGVLLYIKMHVKAHATTTAALTLDGTYLGGSFGTFAPFNGGAVGANAAVAGVVNINAIATTTSVVTSGTPSTYGGSVTFTATVTTGGTPAVSGGAVTFYDGGSCAAPGATLGSANINGSGVAAIATAALFAGNHTIFACYGGTADFTASGGSVAQVVDKRAITVTAATDTKVYDGTTASAGTPTITTGSLATGDTAVFTQTFDTKHVGTGKTLTPTGTITDGNGGNNYDVTYTAVSTGEITKRSITVTAATDTKVYDGTTASAGTPTVTTGSLATGDTAVFTQTFGTKHVGTSKVLTPTGTITDGNSGGNYNVTYTTVSTGEITKRAITVTATTDTKVYDGTTSSVGTPTITTGSLTAGDTAVFAQTFDTKHVGTSKVLTPTGTITDGNLGGNYNVTYLTVSTGEITRLAITVTAATDTRVYNGTTSSAGTPTITSGALATGDTAVFTQTFDTKHVGTGKTLTPTGTITDGNGGNNYDVTYAVVTSGEITAKTIAVTAVTDTKTYDGSTSSAGAPTVSSALISPDSGVFSQTFNNRNAGTSKTLTPTGTITDGNGGNNYAVNYVSVNTGVINKLAIAVTAVTSTKTYDGSTSSAGVPTVSPAVISPDVAGFVQTYDNRNAGTGKTLTPSGSVNDGNSGNNYDVTFNAVATGTINKLAVSVTAVASTKAYDGGISSAGVPTVSPAVISPDAASFVQTYDNRNAGTGKTLTPSGSINDGNLGGNYDITFNAVNTGEITKLAVTVTAVADTKTYDGNTSSAGVPTVSPALISPDSGAFVQTFNNRNAGTGKTLTPSGTITDGNGGGNYDVTFTAVSTGVINKLAVTVTAVTDTKTYDGSTSSAGVPTVSPALISPDAGAFVQTFDNRNAGTGKTLTPSGTINDGNSGGNYTITFTAVNTGVINKLAITVTAVTGTKTYDGNTSSAGIPTALPAVIAPDTGSFVQTYDNRNAGTGKTLTPSGSINDGNSGNNYTITFTAVNTGVINKLAITVTAVTSTKTYDANTSSAGVPTVSPALISPDSGTFTQTFDTANVGTNKTLTPAGTITDGNSGNNYAVTYTAVTTGTINRADAVCTVTGYTVPYDGNAHLATGSCLGVLGETLVGLDLSGTSHITAGTFTDTWTFTDVTGNYNDTSGQVTDTITAGTINGTILYFGGANDPVSNVTVAGAGSLPVSGATNGSGYYTIPGFGSGSYTMTPTRAMQLCDTQNGVLIDDAALVSEYVVGLTPLSTTQKLAAKVSGTATANLSSFDAALIAQKSVGICDSPNIAGRWGFAPATRAHATVTGTLTDDYTGYLMGDVDGNWSSSASPNLANPDSDSPNAVRASLPVGNAQPGTEVTVPFRIDNLNGRSLNSYQFSVAYDPSVIEPADESANVDGTLSGNLNAVYNTPTPGLLRVGVYGAFPTQGDGVYVNLKFRVIGANGSSSPLAISGFRFNHGTDEVTSVNGRITVGALAPDASLQGRVLTTGGRGVTNARVIVTSTTGVVKYGFTNRNGQFTVSGLAIGETYTVAIQSRRFLFTPRTVAIADSVTNVDFIAEQ